MWISTTTFLKQWTLFGVICYFVSCSFTFSVAGQRELHVGFCVTVDNVVPLYSLHITKLVVPKFHTSFKDFYKRKKCRYLNIYHSRKQRWRSLRRFEEETNQSGWSGEAHWCHDPPLCHNWREQPAQSLHRRESDLEWCAGFAEGSWMQCWGRWGHSRPPLQSTVGTKTFVLKINVDSLHLIYFLSWVI